MSQVIQTSDFQEQGKFYIPFNTQLCGSEEDLQNYIDEYEENILNDLLGCELTTLFLADLVNGVPQTQIYLDIYNKICIDLDCGQIRTDGMKKMLMGFIFFQYMRDQSNARDLTGINQKSSENSTSVTWRKSGLYTFHNKALKSYNGIQQYICDPDYKENYPTFNGIHKGIVSPF